MKRLALLLLAGALLAGCGGSGRLSKSDYEARLQTDGKSVQSSVTALTKTPTTSLTAFATNLKPAASKPFRLTVEFLDARGGVVATASHDVPTIPARQSFEVDLKVSGPGIAGWRYRAS